MGADLRNRAVYVTLLACAGMMLFVAYRFKSWGFGIGGVAAVFHTVLITFGLFSVMQWEVDMTVIAAMLTLVGFQMNDMIVVFDRIREMLRVRRREALEKLTNDAINETMSRTVITNGLAFLTVLALLLFGGDVLKSFSWALFIGVVVSTYSTIYIASPVVVVGAVQGQATRGAGRRAERPGCARRRGRVSGNCRSATKKEAQEEEVMISVSALCLRG